MSKIISLLLCISFLSASWSYGDEEPQMTVQGFARLFKPADQVSISISVISEGKTAEDTLKQNSAKMQNVINSLKSIGLLKSEFQTGSFSIHPIMSPRPDKTPSDWVPTIVRYHVTNSLNVETDKLSLVGNIIDTVTKAGANAIDSLVFNLKEPRTYRSQAIEQATAYAIEDAGVLAAASNVKLAKVLNITLDETEIAAPRFKTALAFRESGTPVEAGDVEVRATVKIVYEIVSH